MAELCTSCSHSFDAHSVIATTGDPLGGGVILCPVRGCQCYATWAPAVRGESTSGADVDYIPDRLEIERLREWLQGP